MGSGPCHRQSICSLQFVKVSVVDMLGNYVLGFAITQQHLLSLRLLWDLEESIGRIKFSNYQLCVFLGC